MKVLAIGIFGVIGVLTRYFIDARLATLPDQFPIHTFSANMIGCLIAGALSFFVSQKQDPFVASALLIGFCGGLTTFSGYSLQSLNFFNQGINSKGLIYFIVSPLLGLVTAYIGFYFAQLFGSKVS